MKRTCNVIARARCLGDMVNIFCTGGTSDGEVWALCSVRTNWYIFSSKRVQPGAVALSDVCDVYVVQTYGKRDIGHTL